MILRVVLSGEVKLFSSGAGAKASPNRASQSGGADAKPSDLPLARLKVG